MSSIIITDYNPAWPTQFEEEKARILAVAGNYIEDIQHIGSTSVPGLGAKPTIDILIVLRDLALVEPCLQPLQGLNYEYRGESGIPERHFFRKPQGSNSWLERTHNVHMVLKGSKEWCRMLAFRDYLRTNSEAAQRYSMLKQELTTRYGSREDAYTGYPEGKTEFIESAIRATPNGDTCDHY